MERLHKQVSGLLDGVDFESIYGGFTRCNFALYDDDCAYFDDKVVARDTRFVGNTSIDYDGEQVAIWYLKTPDGVDAVTLAADMVHEMFHAFQVRCGEDRYPSDLVLLDYPDDVENLALKLSENRLLADGFTATDIGEKRTLFTRFVASRLYREGLIGAYILQEYRAETIEGMAEYAGCAALEQLSPQRFAERTGGFVRRLRTLDRGLFDTRRLSYFTGTLMCLTLRQIGEDFQHPIAAGTPPLFPMVAKNAAPLRATCDVDLGAVATEHAGYTDEKRQQFDAFLRAHNTTVTLAAKICGYDPMTMIKLGNRILCSHFVMLQEEGGEPQFLHGPLAVNLRDGSPDMVESYII